MLGVFIYWIHALCLFMSRCSEDIFVMEISSEVSPSRLGILSSAN